MSFVYALALGVGLLVALPYLAHRLRRRRAEERPFAAARLVAPAPPKARRRSKLEDRALFGTRALAVAVLALLGASPLVRCQRLSLQRSGGASVALAVVLDDSMSMRAMSGGRSRFERARQGARELLASAREGDAVAIVLAGEPARVALAATTDLAAAKGIVEGLVPSDRATDLDGALAMARGLVTSLPQVDRRIALLSDLADGKPEAPPVGENSAVPVWAALPEIRGALPDCGVVAADRAGGRVRAQEACSRGESYRDVVAVDRKDRVVARGTPNTSGEVSLTLPTDAPDDLTVKLTGSDAIAADDVARAVTEAGPGAIAVVSDTAGEAAATGGAPVLEQALTALKLDVTVRPIPALPDRAEDLAGFVGVVLDDPPGLTPEQRHALEGFLDSGGVVLLALGPRAAAAPLGASLEPVLARAVNWSPTSVPGADPATALGPLVESAQGTADLAATHRAALAPEDVARFSAMLRWKDGAPLVAERAVGRGGAWITTLPFSLEASDLTLRPAFLALLDAYVSEARQHASPRRSPAGSVWTFAGARAVAVQGPGGALTVERGDEGPRVVPALVGEYHVVVDGKSELRVAAPIAREMDTRPRAVAASAAAQAFGDNRASVDISSSVALVLLAIVAAELALRLWVGSRAEAT